MHLFLKIIKNTVQVYKKKESSQVIGTIYDWGNFDKASSTLNAQCSMLESEKKVQMR